MFDPKWRRTANPLRSFTLVDKNPSCVILGRFKFKDVIDETIDLFAENGINVLAPKKGKVVREDGKGFKLLDSDGEADPWEIAKDFFNKLEISEFAYIVNPDGAVGNEVASEIGFSQGRGLPLYAMEPVQLYDNHIVQGIPVVSPYGMVKMAKEGIIHIGGEYSWLPKRMRLRIGKFGGDESDRDLWENTRQWNWKERR